MAVLRNYDKIENLRTYDVEQDRHPCDLVVKYTNQPEYDDLGTALIKWMDTRKIEIPEVCR